jgi:uncharacterized protein (TIGR03435 family)
MASRRRARVFAILLMLLVFVDRAAAQAPAAERFDVASVLPNHDVDATRGLRFEPGNVVVATAMALRDLIWTAYGGGRILNASQIVGGPAWLLTDRFDIRAKGSADGTAGADDGPTRTLAMLRTLLEDRFEVRVHVERRSQDAYVLVSSRGGAGAALHQSTATCATADWTAPPGADRWCGFRVGRTGTTVRGVTMFQFTTYLGNIAAVGRPVQDGTGLAGAFDFDLRFASEPGVATEADQPVSIFTALQEQLGLRLQGTKTAVDVLVIDQASRPAPN